MKSHCARLGLFVLIVLSAAPATAAPLRAEAMLDDVRGQRVFLEFVSRNGPYLRTLDALYVEAEVVGLLTGHFASSLGHDFWVKFPHPVFNSYRPRLRNPAPGVIRLPAEDFAEAFRAWNITGHPAFLVVDESGNVIAAHEGMITSEELKALLKHGIPTAASTAPMGSATRDTGAVVLPTVPEGRTGYSYSAPATRPVVAMNRKAVTGEPAATRPRAGIVFGSIGASEEYRGEVERARRFENPTLWTVQLNLADEASSADLDLAVYDEADQLVALAEAVGPSDRLVLAVEPDVEYRLHIYSLQPEAAGVRYRLDESYEAVPKNRIVPAARAISLEDGIEIETREWNNGRASFRFVPTEPGDYEFRHSPGKRIRIETTDEAGVPLSVQKVPDGVLVSVSGPVSLNFHLVNENLYDRGPISVSVSRLAPDEPEISSLSPGEIVRGRLGGAMGTEVTYLIEVDQTGMWDIALEATNGGSDLDMEILTENGELLARSENPQSRERIRQEISEDDRYRLRVYRYRGSEEAEYAVAVVPAVSEMEFRPPDRFTALEPNAPVSGRISRSEEIWLRMIPARTEMISLFLAGDENTDDIDLAAYSESGERIAVSQTYAADEALLLRVSRGVTVLIKIFTYGDSLGGNYRVWYQSVAP